MEDSSLALLKEALQALLSAKALGPVALIGTGILFSLRLTKHFLPGLWAKLPPFAKLALPFVLAALGTFLAGFGTLGVLPALVAALSAGATAVAAHHTTKVAGEKMTFYAPGQPVKELGMRLLLDKPPSAKVVRFKAPPKPRKPS